MGASGSCEAASSAEMATPVDAKAAKADGSARIPEASIVACPLAGERPEKIGGKLRKKPNMLVLEASA